ncbi:beta strand repeat-containing protein [Burkholderia lata]|uniref:beta strand repeat-containing protein n=1 Tax=Burkholderia lata (strain ATCC 17760 / DSM 23089 / LMG 22485 / NCIMB 9086 / R18194 / 383) TaxID=482957 RepID=UPI00145365D4|nr:hypothetical protein [Burkholderia lata]VWM20539.1 hypothetical protein BLA6992_07446 [Burkholderia lata]
MRTMKAVIAFLSATAMLVGAPADAQFNSGQVLKATDLNAALASPSITGGTINGSVIGGTNPKAGTFTNLSVTGSLTATGLVTLPALATQAANTVVANVTGSTASPTAFAMPSCSGSNNALRWTSGTGFACASSIALTSGGLNQFAATTSAQLASIVSDETGTGSLVFATNPTIVGASFSAGLGINYSNPSITLNDTSGTNQAAMLFQKNGSTAWYFYNTSSSNAFGLARVVGGSYTDSPITVSNSTGAVTMSDGITNSPISGSTGAFTTLSSTGSTSVAYSNPVLAVNDTSGSNKAAMQLQKNGTTQWQVSSSSTAGAFAVDRYVSGSYVDSPLGISNSTGVVSMSGGLSVTGTTGLGTPTSVGTSVFPTIVAPVSTTATSTNGSTSITVASATGIAVGMGIYGSFTGVCSAASAAYQQSYVTAISGTTVTMSCPATTSTTASVQFGQQRYSATSSAIASDLGAQTLKVGAAAQGNSSAWLNQVSTGQDYRLTSAAQVVSPPGGGYALTTAARSSDATGGASAFPFQSILYLDSWGNTGYAAENVYLQDNLAAATAGHSQPHIQMEQSINSQWGTPPSEDPFFTNQVNQTIAHRYDCGTGQSTTTGLNGCTTAIDIVPNPQNFQNGIVIANGALDTGGGTRQANAMSMPLMTGFTWYSAASTYSGAIYSPSAGVLNSLVPSGGQFNFVVNGNPTASITGTGLNGTAIGQTTAAGGNFTTLSASGLITPSTTNGIKGTAAADNANVGSVGEYASSTVASGSAVSLTSGSSANITSITLTPGDWDVWGIVGTSPGGSTAQSYVAGGVSTTSATLPGVTSGATAQAPFTAVTGAGVVLPVGRTRINVSSNTIVYLVATSNFTGSSNAAYGGLFARRAR